MLKDFSKAYDAAMTVLNKVVGGITITILTAIFFMMMLEVLSRSVFQASFGWTMELSRFGLVFIIFFGGSMLFHESGHISVTLFHGNLSPKALEILKTVFDLVILYFLATYAWYSVDFAIQGMYTPSVTRMMVMLYPRLSIPIGFLLMVLQVLNNLIKRFVKFKYYTPAQWAAETTTGKETVVKEVVEHGSVVDAD